MNILLLDQSICTKYLTRLCKLTDIPLTSVKKDRNRFANFLHNLMKKSIEIQPTQKKQGDDSPKQKPVERNCSQWSDNGKTYFATKVIPGYAILVYMATSDDQSGWQENGFLDYDF